MAKSTKQTEARRAHVEPSTGDLAVVTQQAATITSFVAGLREFFTRATQLEAVASNVLERAQALKPATSANEDAALQRFVKDAKEQQATLEGHWTITQKVHALHKALVAGRSRGTDALERAAKIANDLHNRYVLAEQRRVQEENDRLRREAEERARQQREREEAEAEAKATAAEEQAKDLSERETAFVDDYFARGDGIGAARRAGFKDPLKASARLLTLTKIQAAIKGKREAAAIRTQAAAKREMPLDVEPIETVAANVTKIGVDRSTWSAEVLDEAALIEAVFVGRYGIPRDVLMVNQVKVNAYARELHELIDRWPGVRSKKTTSLV